MRGFALREPGGIVRFGAVAVAAQVGKDDAVSLLVKCANRVVIDPGRPRLRVVRH